MPTARLLALLLIAAPIGAVGGPLVLLAVALVVLAFVAACVDWVLAHDGRHVSVSRVLSTDKLSLGAWNPARLEIYNGSARRQRLLIRDQPPPAFTLDAAAPLFTCEVSAAAAATLTYHVRPPARGDAVFGDLYLRTDGPLGLTRRSFRQRGTASPVRIYPNLRELRRYDLLVRRGLEPQPAGRPIRVAGASTEFERVREYLPDDEFRRVNWKATARRGQPMVNQFEAERSQNLVVLLDAGRNMAAVADAPRPLTDPPDDNHSPRLTKLDHALNAALLLGYVASLRGDRVALLAYADDVQRFVPPQRGHRAVLSTVAALYNLQAQPVEPDHGRAFEFLARRNLRRSLVVLFTDLADRESSTSLAAHVTRAARQHLVVCVTLADPSIRRPAVRRPVDTTSLYEKMVAQHLLDDRAAVLANFAAQGVLTVDTDADALHPRLIGTYLELKERGRV
jgi:uncharacterized protein (DUF58 family)